MLFKATHPRYILLITKRNQPTVGQGQRQFVERLLLPSANACRKKDLPDCEVSSVIQN
jgi:hypothetical protein